MAMKPIALSFKNTQEDKELYKWITSHSNMSGFIKDILKREMKGEIKEIVDMKTDGKNDNFIEFNF